VDQTSYSDLTGHPYAGLMVDRIWRPAMARPGGMSKTITFRLPERVFTDPWRRPD